MTTVHEPVSKLDERASYAAGLHEIADWIAAHPDIPPPNVLTMISDGVHGQIGCASQGELERVAARLGASLAPTAVGGQRRGEYRAARIRLTLVWFAPAAVAEAVTS